MNKSLCYFTVSLVFVIIAPLVNAGIFGGWLYLETIVTAADISTIITTSYIMTFMPALIVSFIYSQNFFRLAQPISTLYWRIPMLGAIIYLVYIFILDLMTTLLGAAYVLMCAISLLSIASSLVCTIILSVALLPYRRSIVDTNLTKSN